MKAEALVAGRLGWPVETGGGTTEGAAEAAARLIAQGVPALLSFGLAGGLDPALPAGRLLIPAWVLDGSERWATDPAITSRFGAARGAMYGGGGVVASSAAKRRLHLDTGALAVDLESAAVARAAAAAGIPFAVLRAICDPAGRDLPPAALAALDRTGGIGALRIARSVLRQPGQIPSLLALARDAARARQALRKAIASSGA